MGVITPKYSLFYGNLPEIIENVYFLRSIIVLIWLNKIKYYFVILRHIQTRLEIGPNNSEKLMG